MEETVTSIFCPGLPKAGSSAESATAATFLSCGLTLGGTVTPSCCKVALSDCTVKGAWLVWSPVPLRPTTSP